MALVTIIELDDLPADGSPATDVNAGAADTLFEKRSGYNSVDLDVDINGADADFAIYRYWDDYKGWRPEGPRGTTPTTFGVNSPNDVPVRISMPFVLERLCVVHTGGGSIDDGMKASLVETNR